MSMLNGLGGGTAGWSGRIRDAYWPEARTNPDVDEDGILPASKRKAAMRSLDPSEVKWSFGALALAILAGIVIPAYITSQNKVTKQGKNTITVAPDAWLLGGVIVLLGVIGMVALWHHKRTLVAFGSMLIGFAFTLFVGLIGFLYIFLGGWLMLRAWRINRYGTTNSKLIAREAAASRKSTRDGRGRGSTRTKTSSSNAPATAGEKKPPAASKRYTPKSPPRKKVPKPN
jgi:hypothetical protein